MEKFELNILGCGSASPTAMHYPSCQVLNIREKLYMIDCGEGAQMQFRNMHLKFNKLANIFISHLHGDHCFGLPGFLSTLGLHGHTGEIVIHTSEEGENVFRPFLDFFCKHMPFKISFDCFDPFKNELIMEDRSVKVYSIPLKHRIPTSGFLFEEKEKGKHIVRSMIDFYHVPVKQIAGIKSGADFTTDKGLVIPNDIFTRPADPVRKYAYCSDTVYYKKIVPLIEGVDLLYHEATFAEAEKERARTTYHSTASQAAEIAKMAKVKKLMLGHYSARYDDETLLLDEALKIFEPTLLAEEGLTVKI